MTELCWLQSRAQTVTAAVMIAVVAVVTAVTGPNLVHLYQSEVAGCAARGDCQAAASAFSGYDGSLRMWLGLLVLAAPAVIGMFWGAPLVAGELADGTFRLAWTQGVTRTRWLGVKLGFLGLASMAAAGLLSLSVTWWASPLDRAAMSRYGAFDERDIVPIGYAAFAFALGVALGVLMRRTLPAMLATLVAFIGTRLAFTCWVRPHLIAPLVLQRPVDVAGYGSEGFLPVAALASPSLQLQPPDIPNAWITSIALVDKGGQGMSAREFALACPGVGTGRPGGGHGHPSAAGAAGPGAAPAGAAPAGAVPAPPGAAHRLQQCGANLSSRFHEVVSYQPGSRYWPLQWYELAIFLAAALALAGLSIWRVRRIG
jgi:hypothetical protein